MTGERPNRDVMTDVIERFLRRETGAAVGDVTALAVIREQATELTDWLNDAGLLRQPATEKVARGTVYAQLRNELVASTREVTPEVNVDLNENLEAVGVEVIPPATVTVDGLPVTVDRVTLRELPVPINETTVTTRHPSEDPVGTLRLAAGDHLFLKLAQPADEPWHLVYVAGPPRWDSWQSDEDLADTILLDHVPVELAFPESPEAEVDAVARALHEHGKLKGLCPADSLKHGWAHHRHQAYLALLAAPRRGTITRAQLDLVLDEYSHGCPTCDEASREWVVLVEDVPEIVARVTGQAVEGVDRGERRSRGSVETTCPSCGATIRSRLGDQAVITELEAQGWTRPPS